MRLPSSTGRVFSFLRSTSVSSLLATVPWSSTVRTRGSLARSVSVSFASWSAKVRIDVASLFCVRSTVFPSSISEIVCGSASVAALVSSSPESISRWRSLPVPAKALLTSSTTTVSDRAALALEHADDLVRALVHVVRRQRGEQRLEPVEEHREVQRRMRLRHRDHPAGRELLAVAGPFGESDVAFTDQVPGLGEPAGPVPRR
jgi:hypothetical protein